MHHLVAAKHGVHPQLVLRWAAAVSCKVADFCRGAAAVDFAAIQGEAGDNAVATGGLFAEVNAHDLHPARPLDPFDYKRVQT